MKYVGLTLRVDKYTQLHESRDAIDQRWYSFLDQCALIPILIPNDHKICSELLNNISLCGIIFSGGNDFSDMGGESPERDQLEFGIIKWAKERRKPILGVCRGMQVIQRYFGTHLEKVEGHIATRHDIEWCNQIRNVNSYHKFATKKATNAFHILARSADDIVKSIEHKDYPICGIMWHPERENVFDPLDISLFRERFST